METLLDVISNKIFMFSNKYVTYFYCLGKLDIILIILFVVQSTLKKKWISDHRKLETI